ncbi:hypothetical protein Tco_1082642 [Tanacetum coccineum]|uniref:Xylulose kinase-1 n=1 Tax=Tanacetum coccineum TaxID=301880 RepID=A0ABQ5I132_9ASTR
MCSEYECKKNVGRDPKGNIIILPPVSAEEQIAVQRATKARTLLLQSLPEDHMADFHHLDDAKDIWLAIKARYRGGSSYKSNHSATPSHSAFVSITSGNNKMSYAETSKQSSSYISASPGSNVLHFNSGNVKEDFLHSFVAETIQQIIYEDFDQIGKLDLEESGHQMANGNCTGKQVESNARYSTFKIKELELDKPADPKALLSVDSMVNWLDHEESANENASQVMAMIVGPRMDEDKVPAGRIVHAYSTNPKGLKDLSRTGPTEADFTSV